MKNVYKLIWGGLFIGLWSLSGEAQAQTTGLKLGSNPGSKDPNAILDLSGTTTQGVLLPRIALTGTSNSAPLAGTVSSGMLVYNTATAGDVTPGVYFSNGTQWVRVASNGSGGMIQAPSLALTSTTNPTGTTGQVLYNTNAAAGVPVGLVVWNGSAWAPASGSTADGDAWGVTGEDPNSSIFRNGNVGIGIAPRESFDIRKGFAFHTGGNLGMFWNAYYDGGLKYGGYGGSNFSGTIDFSPSSGDMYFNTSIASGTEGADVTQRNLLSLKQSGNVGIGTISPTSKLHVEGIYNSGTMLNLNQSTPSWGSAEVFNAFRYIQTNMANGDFKQFNVGGGGVSIGYNTVPTYGSSDALYVNGNVGIGTTTPADKLTVKGGALALIPSAGNSTTGYAPLLLKNIAGNNVFKIQQEFYTDDGKIFFLTDNADNGATESIRMVIQRSNGNVGIGTASPISKTHIVSSSTGINSGLVLQGGDFGAGYGAMWIEGAGGGQRLFISGKRGNTGGNTTTDLTQNVVGSDILLNHDGGNVGIGTTTPAAKFDVNGSTNLRGLITTSEAIELGGLGSGDRFSFIDFHSQDGQDYNARIVREPGANGVFNIINGSSLLTLNTAGNIGIGTSSPTAKLEVAGNARIQTLPAGSGTDDVVTTDANGNLRKMPASTFTGATGPQGPAGPQGATGPAGSNATADGDAWGVTGEDQSSSIGRIGNVGIGTAAPSTKLHVEGTNTIGQFITNGGAGSLAHILIGGGNPNWGEIRYTNVDNVGDARLSMGANGQENIVIDVSGANFGNVGIGTVSPTHKLHVDGGRLAVGSTAPGTWSTNGSDIFLNTGATNSQIHLRPNGDGSAVNQFVTLPSEGHLFFGSDAQEKVRITSTGNVGIGTTTPADKLTVKGGALALIPSAGNSTTGYAPLLLKNIAENNVFKIQQEFNTDDGKIFFLTDNADNGGTESIRMVIQRSNGNVGIGTSSPTSKLHVEGIYAVGTMLNLNQSTPSWGSAEVFNAHRYIQTNSASGDFKQFNVGGGGVSIGYNTVPTYGSSDALYVNGNVGIGTAVPTSKLDVALNGGNYIRASGNDGDLAGGFGYSFYIRNNNHEFARITGEYGDSNAGGAGGISFSTLNYGDFQKRMFIASNGNVGIGTSSPTSKLDIVGTGSIAQFLTNGGAGSLASISIGGGNPNWGEIRYTNVDNAGDARLSIGAMGQENIVIDVSGGNNGNVGIGTTAPTSRLEVNGSATNSAANIVTGTTIDFGLSNLAATNNTGTAITLSNIKNGGAYTLALTSTSATGSVTFSSAGFTFVYVGTAARTSGKKHIYNFIVIGTEVYVTMGTEN